MNRKEERELSYFPAGLDEALTKKFGKGIKAETSFSIISMRHITVFKTKDKAKKKRIEDYIEAFLAGNQELGERIRKANEKKPIEAEVV